MNSNKSQRVYRVDRFIVPATAREEFLEKALIHKNSSGRSLASCKTLFWNNRQKMAKSRL